MVFSDPRVKMSKKYPSKYSNGKEVSAAQYITEIICEKKAKQSKKDLHYRFWISKEWAAYYRNQIGSANKLLQKYDASAIIKALSTQKAEKIYSLRAPHLQAIIDQEQANLDSFVPADTSNIDRHTNSVGNQNVKKKKTSIDLLREIDNDKNVG